MLRETLPQKRTEIRMKAIKLGRKNALMHKLLLRGLEVVDDFRLHPPLAFSSLGFETGVSLFSPD